MARLVHVHLDPVGGIAGDMFVAAMLDAFPECIPGLMDALGRLPAPPDASVRVVAHHDGVLCGRRFVVEPDAPMLAPHAHGAGVDSGHGHVPYRAIRERLRDAKLAPKVLEHALGLFALLAEAEARVHGVEPDEVAFHEAGAWDSIVDFVAAAWLIATLAPERWTVAPLPLGGGRVRTAHGVLPVPSPATTALLQGLEVIDDGIGGERVTPTGAAIVRYLVRGQAPVQNRGQTPVSRQAENRGLSPVLPVLMAASGCGFGKMRLPGIPNMVRVLAFTPSAAVPAPDEEEIATLQFEIDDQTAEDLAVALERVRAAPGVLEVFQVPVVAKKGRLATQVQVLARLEAVDAVADLCLAQTTTLGLRVNRNWRRRLARAEVATNVPEPVRVKIAARPTGELTAKAEMEDVARAAGDREAREEVRRRAEAQALDDTRPHEPRDRPDD